MTYQPSVGSVEVIKFLKRRDDVKKIINYETFSDNEEFRNWQRQYIKTNGSEPFITMVTPFLSGMGVNGYSNTGDDITMGAKTNCGCFISYITEECI